MPSCFPTTCFSSQHQQKADVFDKPGWSMDTQYVLQFGIVFVSVCVDFRSMFGVPKDYPCNDRQEINLSVGEGLYFFFRSIPNHLFHREDHISLFPFFAENYGLSFSWPLSCFCFCCFFRMHSLSGTYRYHRDVQERVFQWKRPAQEFYDQRDRKTVPGLHDRFAVELLESQEEGV